MLPGMELMGCAELAVPAEVMRHVVRVESSFNRYAIGVVGGRLERQPRTLDEAVSTARMLEREGYNFSLGLAQVNRYNLASQGLDSYERAFDVCPNLQAGARILADCHRRAGQDWGKALSCYYSGNFVTGFRHGYVQKVFDAWGAAVARQDAPPVGLVERRARTQGAAAEPGRSLLSRRAQVAMVASEAGVPAGSGVAAPGPSSSLTPGPASPQGADAPVLVQPMAAASRPARPLAPSQADPSADTAFVF